VKTQADLARDLDLVVDPAAVGPQVGVVAGCRAAREQQLRARDGRGAAQPGRRQARPDRVERDEPIEELDVLRTGNRARQRLIEVMMGAHQSRNHDAAARVDDAVGLPRQLRRRPERLDRAVAHEDRGVAQHRVRSVERLDVRRVAHQQRGHSMGELR